MTQRFLVPLLLIVVAALLAPRTDGAARQVKRELLSEHQTVATFGGVEVQKCRGLTSMCPDQCGHSGSFANFRIIKYLVYRKPGQYGDPKAESYVTQVADNHGRQKLPAETAAVIAKLKPGEYLLLNWRHDYVTSTEEGGSGSYPERTITKLQPITKEEADKLKPQE